MILVFDTYCGLCNQIADINQAINYCLVNNYKFTFRFASFRKDDFKTFYFVDFNKLFNEDFLKTFDNYIEYKTLNVNENNSLNYNKPMKANDFNKMNIMIHDYIMNANMEYIIFCQFSFYNFDKIIIKDIRELIKPSNELINIYNDIKKSLNIQEYNMIHYRHESDFINHFKITDLKSLDYLINNIKFKKTLPIYIASTNIINLLENICVRRHSKNLFECTRTKREPIHSEIGEPFPNGAAHTYDNIIFKDEESLSFLNFEQKAFIDFLFGINSVEVYGNIKSSFSKLLNNIKKTKNYY